MSAPDDVVLIVPWGSTRSIRVQIPPIVAAWLRDQLIEAVGEPAQQRPRRPVKLRRGQWID